jgi:hypothetical protein
MTRIVGLVFAVIAILLGGLWLLQGLGIVQIKPILCFADCAPVQGPSTRWAVIGAVTVAIGGFGMFRLREKALK